MPPAARPRCDGLREAREAARALSDDIREIVTGSVRKLWTTSD